MDCKEFREALDLYVDGELTPQASLSARAHLDVCTACRRVEQQLAALRRAVKRVVNQHEPPSELAHDVFAIMKQGRRQSIPRLPGRRPTMIEGAGTKIPFWQKKIAIPAPAFALVLIAVAVLSGWVISMRPGSPSLTVPTGVKQAATGPSASPGLKGFDLTRFDRGEPAAIYKVRLTQMVQR